MKVKDLTVQVNRKNIKNLHLSVMPSDGWVRVSAPFDVDDEAIKLFVLSKYGWIKEKQNDFTNQRRQTPREYVSGESHFLLGVRYLLQVVKANSYTITTKGQYIVFQVKENSTIEQKERYFQEWYRKVLRAQLEPLIHKWSVTLSVTPKSWSIRKMLTKWGSCSYEKQTLLFNLELAKKPLETIEYIVVHEMCHLIYRTHSKEFIALLTKSLPYWRETQKTLNDTYLESFYSN